ncbi:hypothetical protein ACFSCZ_19790 [Siminovitchia sediminis]|uniref:Uncharacterized protein n=1 Tax=Siminovitchia sediminis TaxID=1274353 RepID=A0ABW4KRM7_9BACI
MVEVIFFSISDDAAGDLDLMMGTLEGENMFWSTRVDCDSKVKTLLLIHLVEYLHKGFNTKAFDHSFYSATSTNIR